MFIGHFNRYFEKHARVTYFVLLLIIIATFVIFVTPGDVFRGDKRVKDFGEIYGKKLTVERMQKEMAHTTVGIWMQYPAYFGQDLSRSQDVLFNETLARIRLLHAAHEKGLDKVTDEQIRTAIQTYAPFHTDGAFNPDSFQNFLDYIKRSLDILPSEFDGIVRDNIAIDRFMKSVTDPVTVADDEINAELAEYALKAALVRIAPKDAQPTEEEIQAFFKDRKADLKLPESKNALVALFNFADIRKAMADDATLAASLTPTADEIKAYYDQNGERLYKGKTLQEATAAITTLLSNEKLRSEARRRAGKLYNAFATRVQDEDEAARLARFRKEAEGLGAVCQTSGLVSTEDVISGLKGAQPGLAAAIRNADQIGDVTRMAVGTGYVAVACITEKAPTNLPEALPERDEKATRLDAVRQIIADTLTTERARVFFNEKVKQPFNAYQTLAEALQADKTLDDATRAQRLQEAAAAIDNALVTRFYIEEKRDFALATFAPEAYAAKVQQPGAEEIAQAYEAAKADYLKIRVRLARMYFHGDKLEGDALAALQKKADDALAALKAGEDFQAVSKKFCDGKEAPEDRALVEFDRLDAAMKLALNDLKVGDFSDVIADGDDRVIVKVLERQDGRTLADVQEELAKQLLDAAQRKLADEAAAEFSRQLNEAWWNAVGAQDEKAPAPNGVEMLKQLAAAFPEAKVEDMVQISPYDRGNLEYTLISKVFAASDKVPVTANVVGKDASYVACLAKISEGHLADPEADEKYASVLKDAYTESVEMEAAKKRAEAEKARLSAALAENKGDLNAAAGDLKFTDLTAFSLNDLRVGGDAINQIRTRHFFDPSELLPELEKAPATGTLLELRAAQRAFSTSASNPYAQTLIPYGYQLLYVADRKNADVDDAKRAEVRSRLLSQKQQKALADVLTELEAKSNTRLRPGLVFGRQ